jgi:hypothetical protein
MSPNSLAHPILNPKNVDPQKFPTTKNWMAIKIEWPPKLNDPETWLTLKFNDPKIFRPTRTPLWLDNAKLKILRTNIPTAPHPHGHIRPLYIDFGPSGVRALSLGIAAERSFHYIWYYFSSVLFFFRATFFLLGGVVLGLWNFAQGGSFLVFFFLCMCAWGLHEHNTIATDWIKFIYPLPIRTVRWNNTTSVNGGPSGGSSVTWDLWTICDLIFGRNNFSSNTK